MLPRKYEQLSNRFNSIWMKWWQQQNPKILKNYPRMGKFAIKPIGNENWTMKAETEQRKQTKEYMYKLLCFRHILLLAYVVMWKGTNVNFNSLSCLSTKFPFVNVYTSPTNLSRHTNLSLSPFLYVWIYLSIRYAADIWHVPLVLSIHITYCNCNTNVYNGCSFKSMKLVKHTY